MNSSIVVCCILCLWSTASCSGAEKLDHNRFKRFLIYPRQAPTRYQFITGIGIPADLTYESLVVGYVFKAMYYLPFNATVYRQNPFYPEYPADNYLNQSLSETLDQRKLSDKRDESSLRWAIYKFIEDRLESYGFNGQECMLKAICDASALNFDRQYNIFGELMHILFSPTASKDSSLIVAIDYFEAEKLGRTGRKSCKIYNCGVSILDLISKVLRL